MKKIAITFIVVLLTACSNDVQISSDSTKFMGEELGKTVSGNGELFYDEDKGCFLKTKNGAIADCLLKSKQVFKISVNCESGKSDASIDGVKCGSSIPSDKQLNSQKLCNESRFDDGYYLKQKNGYFWINSQNTVTELVLVREENYLGNEGEEPYTRQKCQDILKNREDARLKQEAVKRSWDSSDDWNYLIGSCTTTDDQIFDNCNLEYAASRNVMQTTFETYQENSTTSYVVWGQEYRQTMPLRFQKANIIINVPIEYKKLEEPNHIQVHIVGNYGECHYISEYFIGESDAFLFQKYISQYGNCTELQKMIFDKDKGVTKVKRLIR
jgi:hypothetical protein